MNRNKRFKNITNKACRRANKVLLQKKEEGGYKTPKQIYSLKRFKI
jgi:hypothetical protein